MRIALLTQGFAIGGGVPTVTRWLRDALRGEGCTVDVHDVATSGRDPISRRVVRPRSWIRSSIRGPYLADLDATCWGANLVELEPMRYRPRRELTRELRGYDLIQVVSGGPALARAARAARRPVALQVATTVREERAAKMSTGPAPLRGARDVMTAATERVETAALLEVDVVLVENAHMLEHVRGLGQERAVLAPPGVDTEQFTPRPDGWHPDGYLLSVCRLGETRKRLDRLVAAYGLAARRRSSTPPLVLAGRGPVPLALLKQVERSGCADRIELRPDVPRDELPDLYRGASVYVQASQEEGLGMSVLEAMASGVPVVATDTAGTRMCLGDGDSGLAAGAIIDQRDERRIATDFAGAFTLVLTSAGRTMALAARRRCEQTFSTRVAVDRFTKEYARLLARA